MSVPTSDAGYGSRKSASLLLLLVALVGCKTIDDILEADVNDGNLLVATETSQLAIAQGETHTMNVTVTRPLGSTAAVQVLYTAPAGITATFANPTTNARVTSYEMTILVAPTAALGQHTMTVRSKASKINDGAASIVLNILPPPSYELTVSKPSVTIARGGIGPLVVRVARTNMPSDIVLSLVAPASANEGITASFVGNPLSSDSSMFTLAVAASVPTGTYALSVKGATSGLADRAAPFSLVVTDDALQLFAPPTVTGSQGGSVQAPLILNRATFSGSVSFVGESLPPGLSLGFSADAGSSSTPDMFVNIGPTTPAGDHQIRVRASGAGVSDAVADVAVTVTPTAIAITLQPASLSLFVASSGSATLSISRTGAASVVNVAVEGAPAGLSVTPASPSTTAASVAVNAVASASLAPGDYAMTLRATPDGFPVSASQTATLTVTVRAAAASGNVIVDFSNCSVPTWFAYQNGSGAWTTIPATAGVYRFTIDQGRGGFAYVDGNAIAARFLSQAELTGATIDACGPKPGTKTIFGSGVHRNANESFTHQMGGGSGSSATATPNFAVSPVRDGTHDFVSWGIAGSQTRGFIRRDVNVADGENIGVLDPSGSEFFTAKSSTWSMTGALVAGETMFHSMSYLTTTACTSNLLYTLPNGFGTQTMLGVQPFAQRPSDFHQLTVQTNGATFSRVVSLSFHDLTPRSLTLPALPAFPFVQQVSQSYKILRAFLTMPGQYQTSAALEYASGTKTMQVSATVAYFGGLTFTLEFPDLTGAANFPVSSAIPPSATGVWTVTFEGVSLPGSTCVEGQVINRARRSGSF